MWQPYPFHLKKLRYMRHKGNKNRDVASFESTSSIMMGITCMKDGWCVPRIPELLNQSHTSMTTNKNTNTNTNTNTINNTQIVNGDLLEQNVEVIVNPWNRNLIPWWLLIPQGVSGAIKQQAGIQPFVEVARHGLIPLGGAILTSAGNLPYQAIIHVAGINLLWMASKQSITQSVVSAMKIVNDKQYASVAFPLIGAGAGGASEQKTLETMLNALETIEYNAAVTIVKYKKQPR